MGQNVYSSFLSFIYLFVSLFTRAIIHAYQVHVFKKKKMSCRSSGRQNCLTYLFVFVYYCKDPAQTVRMHMLIWNFGDHMFSWMWSLISCEKKR